MIGQPPLTPTSHVAQKASGDWIHVTGKLPATNEIEDKTHLERSTLQIWDITYWVLILSSHWVFWTYHSIPFVMQFPDLQFKVPLQSRPMTLSSIFPQSLQMTLDIALKLKPHWHSNYLLLLFSDLNNQSGHGPRYINGFAFW